MDKKQITLKTKALRYFLKFLAVMLILTFVSRAIYSYYLPRVSVTNMKNTNLNYMIKTTGTVHTDREIPLYAVPELRVAEVCVRDGDTVSIGDVLLKYDTVYLEEYIEKLSRQIEIDTLTRADYYTAQAWNSAKILTFQIEDEQKKLEYYQNLLDLGAVMTSALNGKICSVNVTAGNFTGETAGFMIADLSQELYYTTEITEKESEMLCAGDLVNINFRCGEIMLQDCEVRSVSKTTYGAYEVEVLLEPCEVTIGEIGTMSVKLVSDERYECIPLEAVFENNDQHFVYIAEESEGFLGTEYHIAIRNISIVRQNDSYAAVLDSGLNSKDKIVYTNKELYEGQAVRLKRK